MADLVLCSGCDRHVRVSETACPFCHVALSDNASRIAPDSTLRMKRAAVFVFGATIALVACGSDTTRTSSGGGEGSGASSSSGGGGSSDGGSGGAGSGSGGDGGNIAPPYGAPGN